MSLLSGSSPGIISHNIREMMRAGYPHNQAISAALHAAHPQRGLRPKHYAFGGTATPFENAPHLDMGGMPSSAEMAPWYVRQAERAPQVHNAGLLNSAVPGRTDQLDRIVPAGAYVVPADVVSGVGEGNTMAGANILQRVLKTGPHGTALPNARGAMGPPRAPAEYRGYADGGATGGHVPVVLAGGEVVIHPNDVRAIGQRYLDANNKKGNPVKTGHKILDIFVVHARKQIIKEMKNLKGPVK